MRFQAPRGTEDVLPVEAHKWAHVESVFSRIVGQYGYGEIRTPTFEDYELFARTAGETSDIVTKQMYDFFDKGERRVCLKAEGTAPAMRALIEHNLCPQGTTARLWYRTPIFRYERPQKGRLREHHQLGAELVGSASVEADAEIIEVATRFLGALGLGGLVVRLNSLGRETCRAAYREAVLKHAQPLLAERDDAFRKQAEQNPLRLLDSKDPDIQNAMADAPSILDYLEPECAERFETLKQLLADADIAFEIAPSIVRGLDYYTETVFEIQSNQLGSQSAVCGGGRYDGLFKELGGSPTPSVGFGLGIERLMMILEQTGYFAPTSEFDIALISATEAARIAIRKLARELREEGVRCWTDLDGRSLKSQLRQADKSGATIAVLIGDDELAAGTITVRKLSDGSQQSLPASQIVQALRQMV